MKESIVRSRVREEHYMIWLIVKKDDPQGGRGSDKNVFVLLTRTG